MTGHSSGLWERFLDVWIVPYVRDATLWPVLAVVVAHAMVGIAPLLLLSFRDSGVGSGVTLGLLAGASALGGIQEIRLRGRPAELSWILIATWAGAAAAAWVADGYGLF